VNCPKGIPLGVKMVPVARLSRWNQEIGGIIIDSIGPIIFGLVSVPVFYFITKKIFSKEDVSTRNITIEPAHDDRSQLTEQERGNKPYLKIAKIATIAGLFIAVFIIFRFAENIIMRALFLPPVGESEIDAGVISKKVVYEDAIYGNNESARQLLNIQVGNFHNNREYIVALSKLEILFFNTRDRSLEEKRELYNSSGEKVILDGFPMMVDADNDGFFEIMRSGGDYGETTDLLDHSGQSLWGFSPTVKMVGGDLNKDRFFEFYLLDWSYETISQINHNGEIIGVIKPEGLWLGDFPYVADMEVVELSMFPNPVIAVLRTDSYGNYLGKIVQFYDFNLMLLEEINLDTTVRTPKVFDWNGGAHILTKYSNRGETKLINLNGDVIFEIQIGNDDFGPFPANGPNGVPVNFVSNDKPYLALLDDSGFNFDSLDGNRDLSQLTIVDSSGETIYQETMTGRITAISVAPSSDNSGREVLLIGDGVGRLLEYSIQP